MKFNSMESSFMVFMVPIMLFTLPIYAFIPLYIFYPKGLAKIFNSLAGMDIIPKKRINKYILYGLLLFPCAAVSGLTMAGICKLIDSVAVTEVLLRMAPLIGIALYFVVFYYIEKRKGFSLKVVFCEAYYSYLLIFTLILAGVLLFYLGIIFLFIGLAVLILFMCLGGVGDKVNVSGGDLLNSSSDTLTRGLDGEWRDSHGTAYDKHGDEWRPK